MKNLSIIIPVYKVEPYLGLCVDSVLREAPQDAEIILVDDGSPDACPQICDGYAEKDSRVTVIHQENRGLSGARNAGMRAAKGEYLFFLDSDDYLPKGYFQSLLQSDADLVIGNYTAFYTDGTPEITGDFPTRRYDCLQDFLSDFHKYFPTVFNFAWGKLYKASVIKANGLTFSEGISMVEDVLFNTQYYNCCATVAVQADACVQYRQTAGTLSKRYYPHLFSWYCDSYGQIEALLTENGVFIGENERRFYTRLWGNVFECLLRVNDQSADEKQKLYAAVVGNTAAKTAAGFCTSRKTAGIARAVQKGNVSALKRAMRLYTYLADFKKECTKTAMGIVTKIKNRTRWLISFPMDLVYRVIYPNPIIKGVDETVEKILQDGCSVSRYGDGELNIMIGNSIDFQHSDRRLAEKMKAILQYDDERFLVCLPDNFYDNPSLMQESRVFWKRFMRKHRRDWGKLLKRGKIYYDTNMTRFYMRHADKSSVPAYLEKLKKIWDGRDIVFVEGEKSRLGVGNDLFDNAKSIKRILCPAENAFDYYDEIVETVKSKVGKEVLILIALGPTATAMAYDLYRAGYQAIDMGHVDIEYEWYKMGATEKVPVRGKYTNESTTGKIIGELASDSEFNSQIIAHIGEK